MYKGYIEVDYVLEGYIKKVDARWGYYADDYVCTSWRLGLDYSLFLLYVCWIV